jgi:parvulin-like peptidyl-prolyl isomerase
MSLNNMRKDFAHSAKWILGFMTVAMMVTAFAGLGTNLRSLPGLPSSGSNASSPDDVIARINGQKVVRQQYDSVLQQNKQMAQMYGEPSSLLQSAQQHTSAMEMIERNVLEQQLAKRDGLQATGSDIDKERNKDLAQWKKNLNLKDDASVDDVKDKLAALGYDPDKELPSDDDITSQVLVDNYHNYLQQANRATPDLVKTYYRSVHSRHILISNKTRPDAQALALAQQIIVKLKAGADFTSLVKQYSDDPGKTKNNGDDGFITKDTGYVPEFLKAALSLPSGQTTQEPVKSDQYGYFVIQVVADKDTRPADYAKKTADYDAQVTQYYAQQQEESDVQAAQLTAKVVYLDPELRADEEFNQALSTDAGDPGKKNADFAAAIKDYTKALSTNDGMVRAEIHAQLAGIYQEEKLIDKQIAEMNAALQSGDDAQLRLQLGDAY